MPNFNFLSVYYKITSKSISARLMNNDAEPNRNSIDLSAEDPIEFSQFRQVETKRVQNIIYNIYIQQKSVDSSTRILNSSKNIQDSREEKKEEELWQELRRQFRISMAASINQLYTNEKLITFTIHYLMNLPFIQNSKKIIKNIVEYYDPSRLFIKSLIQSLVPVLENRQKSQLNKINVILFTLNTLFMQQSPENPKFNSYVYLNGGEGIRVQKKMRWPFEKSGTICLWYNMSDETKECKLFQINGEKSGFQIVVKNRKIYFEKIKEQRGFSLMRNDSAFLCQAETNTDTRLWVQFEIKKKIFQKALFINVVMNNFVLNNIELDIFTPSTADYSISLFKNFHGKVSSALVFTRNLTKEVQNFNSKQGFIYESDIKNFSYMFDNLLSQVLLLYTSIRAKTYTNQNKFQEQPDFDKPPPQRQDSEKLFEEEGVPTKTIVFDVLNGRNGVIGPEACVYRNISIHKKQMSLYGGLPTYIGFFNILKQHAKYPHENLDLYSNALSELILLFKNIFQSKTASIQQAESIQLFRIMSNFFIQTEMIGYNEDITPKLKELYVSLNNRIIKQKFIKKFIWEIPAGEFLEISVLQNYLNLVQGFYLEEIQNSLNVFNVKDIIYFIIDKYDRSNCCFEHMRSSSIDHKKKIKRYPQILAAYFNIIETIIQIKRYDNDLLPTIHQVIYCFSLNASPCFIDALVKFLTELFQKDNAIEALFVEQFQTLNQAKMGLFSALANSYSWKTKANLINLILDIYGLKMFKEGGQKDLMTLCIRFPTMTSRFSSIKSQDIERSIDMSEDKFSFNSTGVRTVMAMRPLALEDMVQLNDEEIIRVIWQWGTQSKSSPDFNLQQSQNPAIILLADLYKGSTYKIRKHITHLFLSSHDLFLFTPDLMAWVIECLLLCQVDLSHFINSDTIIYQSIAETKQNLLRIISTYRISKSQEQQQPVQNQLDIIKLILISVKSKYSIQISKLYHLVYLHISNELIINFFEEIKIIKFQNQQIYEDAIRNIISNTHRCILEHFIHNGNDDFEFEDQSEMEEHQKQYKVLLQVVERTLECLLYLASPGNSTLMEEANAKRNQIIFEMLFPEEGIMADGPLLNFIFVCLQGLFDNYDDHSNIAQKKLTLTLIKKYLIFMVQVSENSGNLKIQKFQQPLKNIFLNTLGFLQSKYYQYYFTEGGIQMALFKNIQDIKNLILNIFLELIQLMKYIQESSCAKHRSFYELMKPKKKHKNVFNIKNLFPMIWKKVDDHILEFLSLNVETLKTEEVRNKLEEHLKMKRLYAHTISIEKDISKQIDRLIDQQKKSSEVTEKNSVYSYQRNQSEKCKIFTEFEERIAVFMFENNNKVNSDTQQRRIEVESIKRIVKLQEKKIQKFNRVYEGFWANPDFYSFSQNNETFLYENKLGDLYRRVRSNRQSKYLLEPFIDIEPVHKENMEDKLYDEEIFTIDMIEEEGEKISEPSRRKSDKYLNLGFQFLKKKVVQKIKKTALLAKSRVQESHEVQLEKKTEQHYFKEVLLIESMKVHSGTLKLDNNELQFQFRSSTHLQHISLLKNKQQHEDLLTCTWKLSQIETYQLKKFMLKPNSIEFYFKDKFSVFLSFYDKSEQHFSRFVDLIQKYKKIDFASQKIPYALKVVQPYKQIDKYTVTDLWKNREITNFDYLLALNILGGRTNCDLNQYFVFPWILADYKSSKSKKDQSKYRDLERSMGSLGSNERIQKFIEIKNNIEEHHKEEFAQSHHFGFHYSNLPIVLQYLIRLHPYAQGGKQLQGGKFDIADRLFTSIGDSFRNATSEMSDVRQLIPEFFYLPQFMINSQDFDFGIQQNSKKVNNVQLPDGYSNAYDFIQAHREQLQSEQVSANLHKWIDLIFGFKQYGKEADTAFNKFHYLSYENNAATIFAEEKQENRESIESHISYFGKVPSQLFTKPHPKRNALHQSALSQYSEGYTRANPFIKQKPWINSVEDQLIRHQSGVFSFSNEACIHFRYSESNKKYILLRRDGKGSIFNQERSQSKDLPVQRPLSLNSATHFEIFLDKFEYIYIFDESVNFNHLPICSLWSEHLFFGGLWGGKILKCDVITKEFEMHTKHSDTVTALEGNEELCLLVSGSINGEVIIWQYFGKTSNTSSNYSLNINPYVHTSRKLIFKQKIVTHYGKINKIQINSDLRVAVCSGEDGLVSVIDTERYEVIRVIKVGVPVMNAIILNYPYYMFFISCRQNKQMCFSLNGQFLDEANFQALHPEVKVILINGYQERLIIKNQNDFYFSMIKLPQLREELKTQIKKDDNQVLQFQAVSNQSDIQIIFNTATHLIHCCNSIAQAKKPVQKKAAVRLSQP